MALVTYDESSTSETSDIEDGPMSNMEQSKSQPTKDTTADNVEAEYKMRMPISAKLPSLISNLVVNKNRSRKLLLSLPIMESVDSSGSSEDEESDTRGNSGSIMKRSQKKIQPSKNSASKNGLLSILPPARSAGVRDSSKQILLVPQQVAAKRLAPRDDVVKKDTTAPAHASDDVWEVSMDEEIEHPNVNSIEDTNPLSGFFSFYQKSEMIDTDSVSGVRAAVADRLLKSMSERNSPPNAADESDVPIIICEQTPRPSDSLPRIKQTSLCRIAPAVLGSLEIPEKQMEFDEDEEVKEFHNWTEKTFVPGPERKRARLNLPGTKALPVSDLLASSNQSIREVSQTDLTAGADIELIKSVTADESQYVSKRSSTANDPGRLAHQKHQITWLAHQAQEQEIELEKRWAEARRNKASNRAKYGF